MELQLSKTRFFRDNTRGNAGYSRILSKKINISLMFILFIAGVHLQAAPLVQDQVTVSGTVTDSEGLPLPGVTVMEEGTNNGTQTDFDGNYEFEVGSENATLVFTFIGMVPAEIDVDGRTTIDVSLENDTESLDEVVLVGYGTQRKISVVGAQSTVDTEELQQPVANIGTMLAGRVAGLTGVQRSGMPGDNGADLWIRGISTFGNAGPLILVDGVERSLDNLDPRDIESFSILKDASATAVYGVRGANGVILIKTKRGKIGKPEVSIEYTEGITSFTQEPELADGLTYMQLRNEALETRGDNPQYSDEYIERTVNNYDPLLYPNVDWFDEVFRDYGQTRRGSANVSGGAEDARYYVSVGYYDETGLFTTDGVEDYNSTTRFKRYNVTSNLTLDITPTTNMNLGVQGYISEGNYPGVDNGGIFSATMEAPPVEYPVIYPGGYVPGRSSNGGLRNPYADVAKRGYRTETKNQLYSNINLNQDLRFITEGLSFRGLFSFDTYNQNFITRSKRESTYFVDQDFPYTQDGELILRETFNGENFLGYGSSNDGNRRFYIETSLNYDRTFGKHTFGGLLLFNRNDYIDAFAGNFTESIPFRNQGLAGRFTYAYDDRFFFEANAGYNGSENFAPENRYGFFPSLAAGWVISNEKFFEPLLNTISYLKIRYSDGLVGTESGAGRFSYLNRVEAGQGGFDFGETPSYTEGIAETYYGANVTWAEARKQDLGIEMNLFNDSFRLIFDLFKERTEGAFLQREDVPNYIGLITNPFGNIGIVENKGFDGSLDYNKTFNELRVGFRSTFSYNRNEILQNGQPEQRYPWLNREGSPLLGRWGYVAERLYTTEDDTNGDGFISPEDGEGIPSQFGQIMPGDIKFTDLNGDGQIDANDQRQIGQGDVPALTYGFGLNLGYKAFDMAVFFQGQMEADMMMSGQGVFPFVGGGGTGNMYAVAVNRWTEENDDPYAMYPRLSFGESGIGQNNNTQPSTWWQRNVDFIRLKTAEFGYTLPDNLTERINANKVRFFYRGTNLLTFSSFDLWDPELTTSTNGGGYPNISVSSIGVNINF